MLQNSHAFPSKLRRKIAEQIPLPLACGLYEMDRKPGHHDVCDGAIRPDVTNQFGRLPDAQLAESEVERAPSVVKDVLHLLAEQPLGSHIIDEHGTELFLLQVPIIDETSEAIRIIQRVGPINGDHQIS